MKKRERGGGRERKRERWRERGREGGRERRDLCVTRHLQYYIHY